MKLSQSGGLKICADPRRGIVGVLLFGPEADLVALQRQSLVKAITDGDGMRQSRLDAADIRKDASLLETRLRERGFFPGRRSVLVERATDGLVPMIERAVAGLLPEDALLVLEAETLPTRSNLRKLFENGDALAAIAFYPGSPSRQDLIRMLAAAGVTSRLPEEIMQTLEAIAADLDTGNLTQFIEKVALNCLDGEQSLSAKALLSLAPTTGEGDVDALVAVVASGQSSQIGPILSMLWAMGLTPHAVLIRLAQHLRSLLSVVNSVNPEQTVGRLRPPVFGPRRQAMLDQANHWAPDRLDQAIRLLHNTEATLRTPGTRPDLAIVERRLIHIAALAGRR
ncbi:MAG: hypothetical protein AAF713_03075 [Pseudomonadota bacterium]